MPVAAVAPVGSAGDVPGASAPIWMPRSLISRSTFLASAGLTPASSRTRRTWPKVSAPCSVAASSMSSTDRGRPLSPSCSARVAVLTRAIEAVLMTVLALQGRGERWGTYSGVVLSDSLSTTLTTAVRLTVVPGSSHYLPVGPTHTTPRMFRGATHHD